MKNLDIKLEALVDAGVITRDIGEDIEGNFNTRFVLRPYQLEALSRFKYYVNKNINNSEPIQLLFHMATGSGKTLIMAGCILDLYKRGYSNFIFFVNNSNILNKTKSNFLEEGSIKYLFNSKVFISGKKIDIKEVKNFESANPENINIVFTTIQALHSRLNEPCENCISYEDFKDKKIVLISDEAHHINADSKAMRTSKKEQEKSVSWEETANRIFDSNRENFLLEFTATADITNEGIREKYEDKTLFSYPLVKFRNDKYSKDVQLLQADLKPFQRALQAVIISQYRKKVFEKNKIDIKPVILFKSKSIKDSRSFLCDFNYGIKNLSPKTINELLNSKKNKTMKKINDYFKSSKITIENIIMELQVDFSEDKCISVDSKNDSEEKQLIVNNLEERNNLYRAIFAVDKLNEGWDVLNLFDIVRLYNTRDADAKSGKVGKTTTSEAQLIGRGARYCPFKIHDLQTLDKRKYDEDIENELRICEQLYYHCAHNPRYISELNKALVKSGIMSGSVLKNELKIKNSFKKTDFYKKGFIYINEREKNRGRETIELEEAIRCKVYKKSFLTGWSSSMSAFENDSQDKIKRESRIINLSTFNFAIIHKAINRVSFFRFNNLLKYYPNLKSMREFITSSSFLGGIKIEVEGSIDQVRFLTNNMKLETAIDVLKEISKQIVTNRVHFKGTKNFKPKKVSSVFKDKVISISVNRYQNQEYGISQSQTTNDDLNIDLSNKHWFVFNDNFGTSEEKYLVKYIDQVYVKLKKKYSEVYLFRNQNHFKIFSFCDGKAIEPDFVMFLKKKGNHQTLAYQLFMEPKGGHLIEKDIWKERFLLSVEKNARIETIHEDTKFKIIGMPFYNENTKAMFINGFEKVFCK